MVFLIYFSPAKMRKVVKVAVDIETAIFFEMYNYKELNFCSH